MLVNSSISSSRPLVSQAGRFFFFGMANVFVAPVVLGPLVLFDVDCVPAFACGSETFEDALGAGLGCWFRDFDCNLVVATAPALGFTAGVAVGLEVAGVGRGCVTRLKGALAVVPVLVCVAGLPPFTVSEDVVADVNTVPAGTCFVRLSKEESSAFLFTPEVGVIDVVRSPGILLLL